MSNTKRRLRHLKSASTRAALNRRSAGARAAKTTSAQATTPSEASDASARTGARFIVIERTKFPREDSQPHCPFAVVEAATGQIPENFFGRDWQGQHTDRASAEAEAAQLNALAGRFLTTTEPLIAPASPSPIDVPGPVFGDKPTAWELQLLAPTQEMPVITAQDADPLELPGAVRLRAAVHELARHPEATDASEPGSTAKTTGVRRAADTAPQPRLAGRPRMPVDDGAPRPMQLPRIIDALHADPIEGSSCAIIPGLRRALIHEIRHGEQVACTDGSWRTTAGGSLRDGVAVLVMEDLTEHAFNAALRFWVRTAPAAPQDAGLHRPPCPNGCFRTQADFHLCTCNFGCGCAPHPAPPRHHALADTRELHLAGAVA